MKSKILFHLLLLTGLALAQDPSSWGQAHQEYVLTGAKIMVAPGQTLPKGDLHIKDGKVVSVGRTTAGQSVRRIDLSGLVIHPGFIDPYVPGSKVGMKKGEKAKPTSISGPHPRVHDDVRVSESLDLKAKALDKYRKLGFVVVGVAPEGGIFRGQGAIYKTGQTDRDAELLLNPSAFSTIALEELGWGKLKGENYPLSMMGSVALIRQTFSDSAWYQRTRAKETTGTERPDFAGTLESLAEVRSGQRMLVGESKDFLETLRMMSLLEELGFSRATLLLSGEEWKNLGWFKGAARPGYQYILPLNFPKNPKSGEGVSQDALTLSVLRDWFSAPANPRWLSEKGVRFSLTTHNLKSPDKFPKRLQEAIAAGLARDKALAALTTEPARLLGLKSYGTLEAGKSASFVIRDGDPFSGETVIREVWIDGRRYPDFSSLAKGESPEKKKIKTRDFIKAANYAKPPVLLPKPHTPGAFTVSNASLWTQDGRGVVKGDFATRGSKIVAVGESGGGTSPAVNGRGWHITPGIVDAHSHTAVDGMVNEPGANITAMVRMKDVIDPFDHDLYLQLASGVTTANILHGSANAIGGQSITCKWRYGEPPENLIFEEAPEGIKFALGENPKASNWGSDMATRYPQSRMGVIELIRGAFISARNYQKLKAQGADPRPDLLLEALVDVLENRRLIHCHSYRQDEILALIRTAEEVGFKVHVFQHVLEGYKVATEIAEHGAAASTFADWWAYKVEVEDAIPYNTTLMHEAGVNVSVNSDSNDLARRLNTEAAKSIRYGGMTEVEALNMITKNGAEQLGVLDRTGTLTVGKDADFVIWSAHPLTQEAVVLETWIDGKRYFKRSDEPARVAAYSAERERYLELLKTKKEEKKES